MGKSEKIEDERSAKETEKVRDDTLKTMLNTPPESHKDTVKRGGSRGQKK